MLYSVNSVLRCQCWILSIGEIFLFSINCYVIVWQVLRVYMQKSNISFARIERFSWWLILSYDIVRRFSLNVQIFSPRMSLQSIMSQRHYELRYEHDGLFIWSITRTVERYLRVVRLRRTERDTKRGSSQGVVPVKAKGRDCVTVQRPSATHVSVHVSQNEPPRACRACVRVYSAKSPWYVSYHYARRPYKSRPAYRATFQFRVREISS